MLQPARDDRLALRERLAGTLPGMLDEALARVTSEVAFTRHPEAGASSDVERVIRQNLDHFGSLLRQERLPAPEEIELMMRAAARRAEERVPLPEVLAAYFTGFRYCWEQSGKLTEGDESADLIEVGSLALSYLQTVTTAVIDAYVETTTALSGQDREGRATLLAALLAGTDRATDWHAAGLDVWDERSVVVLRLARPRHEDDATMTIEARRRTRAIRKALIELTGNEVLDDLTTLGGVVVLDGRVDPARLRLALFPILGSRWHAGLAVADEHCPTPEAAAAAADCAEVADRLNHPSGVHQLAGLLLEVQVTRPGPARTALRQLLRPLEDSTELVQTLAVYVEENGRRAVTAARLHVHPNTLDYRLRRIRELTGIDPCEREGGQLLRAALVVREFVESLPRH